MILTRRYQPKHRDVDKPAGFVKRWLRRKLRRFVKRMEALND